MDQAAALRDLMKHATSPKPRILAVTSGKGGVGKSTLTINMALALAKTGKRVVILDLDVGFGNIETLVGANATYSFADVKSGEVTMKDALVEGPLGIRFLSGGSGFLEMIRWSEDEIARVHAQFQEMEQQFDIVLLDTGAGMTDIQMSFLVAADEGILVTTPEPTALTDAYSVVKMIHHHRPDFAFHLVINQCMSLMEGRQTATQFQKVCKEFLHRELPFAGLIMKDDEVNRAVKRQYPLLLHAPKSPAAKSIEKVVYDLVGMPPRPSAGLSGFLRKLVAIR